MPKTTGSQLLAKMLHGYGVTHVFYVPCLAVNALAELEDLGVRRVVTHSEKAAAYMADGFARASGRPGVCFSQHIGASNLASGLRDAFLGGVPVLALCGGPEPGTRFRHGYQDLEDVSQFGPVTKSSSFVDRVDRLPDLLRQAFRAATSGAPGPVHLGLCGRTGAIVDEELDDEFIVEPMFKQVPALRPGPEMQSVKDAIARILQSERPIIVAGGGVVSSGAERELLDFAATLGVPVATSLNAKHVIPDGHALSVGVVGTYSRSSANKAVAEADLVFFIGSHTGGQVTHNWQIPRKGATVIQLDIDPLELGRNYPNSVSIVGDARTCLTALLAEADGQNNGDARFPAWWQRVRELVRDWRDSTQSMRTSDAVPMRPERLCEEISNLLPENAVVVSDTGHAGIWSGTLIELRFPGQRYIRCAGSMGWGLPGAIGAKFALPDRPVVLFTGDGAFYYHLPELETAARHGVNLIVVVNNNSALSQEMPGVLRAYGNTLRGAGSEMFRFSDVDFAGVARSLGCVGLRAGTPLEFRKALSTAFNAERPVVIDATTDIDALPQRPWV